MNKHIELVKKWLVDPDSVSQEELKVNAADACDAYHAYRAGACYAANAAYANTAADAAYWVKRYEEFTK
jgi:hypothetical protein